MDVIIVLAHDWVMNYSIVTNGLGKLEVISDEDLFHLLKGAGTHGQKKIFQPCPLFNHHPGDLALWGLNIVGVKYWCMGQCGDTTMC